MIIFFLWGRGVGVGLGQNALIIVMSYKQDVVSFIYTTHHPEQMKGTQRFIQIIPSDVWVGVLFKGFLIVNCEVITNSKELCLSYEILKDYCKLPPRAFLRHYYNVPWGVFISSFVWASALTDSLLHLMCQSLFSIVPFGRWVPDFKCG